MAMRSAVVLQPSLRRLMEGTRSSATSGLRYFGDGRGKVLSEEERAAENVYIQKMEREKMRQKAETEKADKEKGEKKTEEEPHKS